MARPLPHWRRTHRLHLRLQHQCTADNYAADIETDQRRNTWLDPTRGHTTVAEWVTTWFAALDLDPRTIDNYRSVHLERHDNEFVFTAEGGTWLWRSTFVRRVLKPAVNGNEGRPSSGVRTVPIRPGLTFHLSSRVTEVYSHVAPEVELRLLNDLQRRWHDADLE